jgi:hypothetical protein
VPAVGLAQEARDLRLFKPEGSRCTFATVGGRKPVTTSYQRGEGNAEARVRLFCFDQPACRCQVHYFDLPDATRGSSPHQLATWYGPESWSDPGKLRKVGPVRAGEQHQGEDLAVTGLPNNWTDQVRVFVTGNRVYFVSASYANAKKAAAEPQAKAFLDSFRIVEK